MSGWRVPKTPMGCYRRAIQEAAQQDIGGDANNGGFPTTTVAALIRNVFAVPFSKIHKDINKIVDKAAVGFKGPVDTESQEFKKWWKRNFGE